MKKKHIEFIFERAIHDIYAYGVADSNRIMKDWESYVNSCSKCSEDIRVSENDCCISERILTK